MKFEPIFYLSALFTVVFACKNDAISEDVKKYCDCLEKNQSNPIDREDCLILMDEIKGKYGDDDASMLQVLEETDNCF